MPSATTSGATTSGATTPQPVASAPSAESREPSDSPALAPSSGDTKEPFSGTTQTQPDPTDVCAEREPVVAPPGYQPRQCEQVLGAEQSAHETPYLLWDFDFRYHEYAPCSGYRYAPSHVSYVDRTGRVIWCMPVTTPEREERLTSVVVDNHRLAPWLRPLRPWRALGDRLLVFYEGSVVWLDPKDGKVLQQHAYAPGARLPYYDGARVRFRVRGTRCETRGNYTTVLQDCGGLLLMFSPDGFVLAFDEATGKLVETLTFREEDLKRGPHATTSLSRAGKRFSVLIDTVVFLQ